MLFLVSVDIWSSSKFQIPPILKIKGTFFGALHFNNGCILLDCEAVLLCRHTVLENQQPGNEAFLSSCAE